MNLLLLLYAMIAGLTGTNVGPSTIARAQEIAQARAVAGSIVSVSSQAQIAVRALLLRQVAESPVPSQPVVDARRIAIAAPVLTIVGMARAAPERRRE